MYVLKLPVLYVKPTEPLVIVVRQAHAVPAIAESCTGECHFVSCYYRTLSSLKKISTVRYTANKLGLSIYSISSLLGLNGHASIGKDGDRRVVNSRKNLDLTFTITNLYLLSFN